MFHENIQHKFYLYQLAPIVVDLISLVDELPRELLLAAQKNDKTTSRIVNVLETSLQFASTLNSRWVN